MAFSKGLLLTVVPPKKHYTLGTESLSSGENSIFNLVFFLCLNSFTKSRFVFLDEIDSNLDAENLGKFIEAL